jgi:cellulose synthase/poly-beta-1,6-N-acetylglucosamine synthase-like glycosyltransferase
MPKVLVVVITEDSVMPECERSIRGQDYPNFDILIDVLKGESNINRIINIVNHRNTAREKALKTDADYFFLVDSDVVLPINAISSLMLQLQVPKVNHSFDRLKLQFPNMPEPKQKHIMGGWYRLMEKDGREVWNCANWVANNVIASVEKPQNSVIRVDKIDLGCVMMSREVLEKVSFKHGFDLEVNKNGRACECLMFARDAQDAGYELFMNGDVVCEHIKREVNV